MSILNSVLKVFVGDKSKQDVKAIMPIVKEIKLFEPKVTTLSHDELRAKTEEFKSRIKVACAELEKEIEELRKEINNSTDIDHKEELYEEIDQLNDKIYSTTQDVLNAILPEAFAVVKETAKRFVQNTSIKVTASAYDREIAGRKPYVTLEGDYALLANSWDAAGKPITWDMIHYDVKLIGGVAMHQ